ncbi:MAG: glycoside hydrolase family 3 C-terminal domain-containing protein, partial [Anaerolineaceae bacterium]|nr:glycoside hydrolase family 3 C-terminal domain-containing protein [Anaerolineaceae bacterium]
MIQRSEPATLLDGAAERSVDAPAHRKVIRQAGQEAIVLLKNNAILPLDPAQVKSIAVIGENAYYPQILGGGSSSVAPHYVISPLNGIRNRAGTQINVTYAPGCFIHQSLPSPTLDTLLTAEGAPGLLMEFFDNDALEGAPAYSLITKKVHIGWFDRSVPEVSQDKFSVRLSGYFVPKQSGRHTLGLKLVGWGKMAVGNKVIVNTWDANTPEGEWLAEIDLQAGTRYPISIEYKWTGDTRWRMLSFGHLPPHADDLMGEAIGKAEKADLAIVVAGLTNEWESEGFDRPNMRLPGEQDALIKAIAGVNPNTIVVLNCGGPVEMPWLPDVAGVVQMWYDGQEQGNGLADILFGDVSPSGKLPITFPEKYEDNPSYENFPGKYGKVFYEEGVNVGYRFYDSQGVKPLFPFGFGLSYTRFDLFDLRIVENDRGQNEISVKVKVKNIGDYPGKEVVQLYVREQVNNNDPCPKQLRSFQKISLAPQKTAEIEFVLDREAFWRFDVRKDAWSIRPGSYEIIIGHSSVDERLVSTIEIND